MEGNYMWRVQLFKLNYDEQEQQAVKEVLDSAWLTMGQKTIDFEAAFSAFLGNNVKCLAVSNGTAALHLALLACGIQPGDEVITPSLTFIADQMLPGV
jgi:dTDP-4-amino-4,6-dideoxygalactose transaminase